MNCVEDAGAGALAAALRTEACLPRPRHQWRRRGGRGGGGAGGGAADGGLLTSLDLGNNGVGDAGAAALATARRTEACKLTSLDLGDE